MNGGLGNVIYGRRFLLTASNRKDWWPLTKAEPQ